MTLTTVRDGLATRLDTISGLRVYATPPDAVQELPAAIIVPDDPLASYDQVMDAGDVQYSFTVLLLLNSADEAQAWADLEPYISPTGASSVKAAVDGTLGGDADWARVVRTSAVGKQTYNRNSYWGAKFRVEAYESG